MDDNCHVEPITKKPALNELQNLRVAFLDVWGMGCPNCATRVQNSLLLVDGVADARVDHRIGKAQVAFNPAIVTDDDLVAAVVRAGGDGRHEYGAAITH
jgi:copper chaperone CopZ